MSNFIDTIDKFGDEELCIQIIQRTITEFRDSRLTSLGRTAFKACRALVSVRLPAVTVAVSNVFADCSGLIEADFSALTDIQTYAFAGCNALNRLILRSGTVCSNSSGYNLSNTPIMRGTGYIYVPRALVDSYKVATNWSTYASQFRALEDYTVDGTITGELDESKI